MSEVSHELRETVLRTENGSTRLICPECSDGRTRANRNDKVLSVERFHDRAVYNCWHCGIHGIIKDPDVSGAPLRRSAQVIDLKPPEKAKPMEMRTLGVDGLEYLMSRGISETTAKRSGLFQARWYFRNTGDQEAIGFPYKDAEGKHYATKLRPIGPKDFSCNGAPADLWGIENVVEGEDVLICEGEMDRLSYEEIGIKATSVPNGAWASPTKGNTESERKSIFLANAEKKLLAAKRVIISGDNDKTGLPFQEELARRIGMHRCWRVIWPEGVKDANDCLVNQGPEILKEILLKAKPWPVDGLYDADEYAGRVREIYSKGYDVGASTGYGDVDKYYSIKPGRVTICTGVPGHGKSNIIDQLMVNVAEKYDWRLAIFSPENEPEAHIVKLTTKRMRKPFFKGKNSRMTEQELDTGIEWVRDHFLFLQQKNGDLTAVDWILERARAAVLRYGIRGLVIDPYNYIHRDRALSETEYVSDLLSRLCAFAKAHQIHIWLVAHPTKLIPNGDGTYPICGGYHISGSAAWYAKADFGITIWRNPKGDNPAYVVFDVWKVRFSWEGQVGRAGLLYDGDTERYNDAPDDGEVGNPRLNEKLIMEPWN